MGSLRQLGGLLLAGALPSSPGAGSQTRSELSKSPWFKEYTLRYMDRDVDIDIDVDIWFKQGKYPKP